MKHKSLREIETIRQSKKSTIVNQALGEASDTKDRLNVTPGEIKFINIPVVNTYNQTQTFSIKVMDPDEDISGLRPEFAVVTQPGEW